MERAITVMLLSGLIYGVPLAIVPGNAAALPVLLGALLSLTLVLSQPDVSKSDVKRQRSTDHNSVVWILAAAVVAHAMPVVEWGLRGYPWPTPLQLIGGTVAGMGLAFRLHAIRLLGQFFTSTVQITANHRLVTVGIYAHLRHPSYLGALVAIGGHALIFAAPVSAFVGLVLMLLVYRYRITVEEQALIREFGEGYRSYARKTYRLVPYVW